MRCRRSCIASRPDSDWLLTTHCLGSLCDRLAQQWQIDILQISDDAHELTYQCQERGDGRRGEEDKARITEVRAHRDPGSSWARLLHRGQALPAMGTTAGHGDRVSSWQHAGPGFGQIPAGFKEGRRGSLFLLEMFPQCKWQQLWFSPGSPCAFLAQTASSSC